MRLSEEAFAAHQKRVHSVEPVPYRTKNKYGAERTAGSDSKKESRRLQELRLLQKAGAISDLIPQVTFMLIPPQDKPGGGRERAVKYTCDALYVENGRLVVEDSKSEATKRIRDWHIRRKQMLSLYGIEVREV